MAIVTCWIRARRSFHSRIIRPNNTPQDYLDYISDNEFTPLTTSEFLASLQERPPTYNQSEEMSQQENPQTTRETLSSAAAAAGDGGSGREETSRTQSSTEQASPSASSGVPNEGAAVVVERRRPRRGSGERERQRRRRRVVIVESGAGQPDESSVTVTSTQDRVVVTYEEEGGATPQPRPSSQSNPTPSENDKNLSNKTSTPPVEQLVSLELTDPPGHTPSPSQQEIGAIEARVNMVEGLSPPPISEHHATPTASTSDDVQRVEESNLIDFSAPLLPSNFSLPSVWLSHSFPWISLSLCVCGVLVLLKVNYHCKDFVCFRV